MTCEYGEAKTIAEIEEEEAARKAEEEKAKRTKNLGAVAASGDEVTLLAALIQAESGNQPYEGQLAVGAVVMNRVRSGSYPNSMLSLSRDSSGRRQPDRWHLLWQMVPSPVVCRPHRRLSTERPSLGI